MNEGGTEGLQGLVHVSGTHCVVTVTPGLQPQCHSGRHMWRPTTTRYFSTGAGVWLLRRPRQPWTVRGGLWWFKTSGLWLFHCVIYPAGLIKHLQRLCTFAKIVELGTKTISVILINIDDGRRAWFTIIIACFGFSNQQSGFVPCDWSLNPLLRRALNVTS